jgi:RNA recognition motif-containing protein
MASEREGNAAIAEFNGKEVNGRSLTVNEARPREDRGGGGGGFGGNRRSSGGGGGGRGGYGGGRSRLVGRQSTIYLNQALSSDSPAVSRLLLETSVDAGLRGRRQRRIVL